MAVLLVLLQGFLNRDFTTYCALVIIAGSDGISVKEAEKKTALSQVFDCTCRTLLCMYYFFIQLPNLFC